MTDSRIEAVTTRLLGTHPSWFKALVGVRSRSPEHPDYVETRSAARTIAEAAVRSCDETDQAAGVRRISLQEAIDNVAKSEWLRQHADMNNPPPWDSADESSKNVFRRGSAPVVTLALTGELPVDVRTSKSWLTCEQLKALPSGSEVRLLANPRVIFRKNDKDAWDELPRPLGSLLISERKGVSSNTLFVLGVENVV